MKAHLWRQATAPGTSSSVLMAKVKALNEFAEQDVPVPLDRVREELEGVIATTQTSYVAQRAVSMALRLLQLMDGEPTDVLPSEHPEDQAPPDYWHPDPDGWADLDAEDSQGLRDAWRERLEGLPPWTRG